jgi:putative ABC transport system ATP-binding protein
VTPAIVDLDHVWRVYRTGKLEVPALVDASLRVVPGEFVAIVGPSGSGKSTLMHVVGCLDRPTAGVYRIAGTPVGQLGDDDLAQLRSRTIGFVFQSFNLLPRTTALGLGDRLTHEPSELSGGEQQRVAIARALVTEPALILADEPTGNLDSQSGADVLAILRVLHAAGRTILLITHDRTVAAAAERQVHIADGRLAA